MDAFIAAGYSAATASAGAARLVKNCSVSARICELRVNKAEVSRIDAAWLLSYFAEILKSDIGDIIEKEDVPGKILEPATLTKVAVVVESRTRGAYKPIHEWPLIWRQQLRGLEVEVAKERSHDGKLPVWDAVATVTKTKYMSREKIAELAGLHIGVKAFEAPKQTVEHVTPEAVSLSELFKPEELIELRDRLRARAAADVARRRGSNTPPVSR